MEGDVTAEEKVSDIPEEKIKEVLAGLVGIVALSVPQHSAVKKDGIPLYKYARQGEVVEIPKKDMEIRAITFQSLEPSGDFLLLNCIISVSSGVYIRSVAEEVGSRLGIPATVTGLRRISISEWSVTQAYPLTYERVGEVLTRYRSNNE
jgi:tRNA pseudouridine55 synthase